MIVGKIPLRRWLATSLIAISLPAVAAPVDAARIIAADREPGNWLSHGRTNSEQRFSPLRQITPANVGRLGLSWSYDIHTRTARGLEATPIVVDGVMYVATAWSHVVALDAKTGRELWTFDPKVDGHYAVKACCDVVNRGVAVWGGKVYIGVLDGRLIALDAKTGATVWTALTVDQSKDYTITGAPRVVKGKVLIGNGGAEYDARGYVSAYDADTGKLVWRFYTVPGNPADGFETPALARAAKTWHGKWWQRGGGGGTVWDSMAYDPQLDLLYIGVGNGASWNRQIRSAGKGDNLYLSSIVALRPDTGEYVWHFQTTPGDEWDYTATQHMILADLRIGGKLRKVLMQAPKNGFFYVLDRATGAFISGAPYIHLNWAKGLDAHGRPLVDPAARYSETGKAAVVYPNPIGGHNWQPMSYSPLTGLVYIPARELGATYKPTDPASFVLQPGAFNLGVDLVAFGMPEDYRTRAEIQKTIKGRLIAWNPVTQREQWAVDMPVLWNGGVVSTAGNLVFEGNGQGNFVAYAADTGKPLWSYFAQTGIVAAPITYSVDGEQYVTVLAGWGGTFAFTSHELSGALAFNDTNRVLTFKLGATGKLPASTYVERPLVATTTAADAATLAHGKAVYQRYCLACHGDSAVGSAVTADLRRSRAIADAKLWHAIVREGIFAANGMVSFANYVSADDAEAVRAYVIKRANDELQHQRVLAGAKAP
jgi:PQQ-dependent dehydrogenase (methanol/ethanol family)